MTKMNRANNLEFELRSGELPAVKLLYVCRGHHANRFVGKAMQVESCCTKFFKGELALQLQQFVLRVVSIKGLYALKLVHEFLSKYNETLTANAQQKMWRLPSQVSGPKNSN